MTTRAILTDIEGTTSSIRFVHDVLFPYASEHLAEFVTANRNDARIAAILDDAREAAGRPDAGSDELIEQFADWIAADKKVTALKSLQGHMWRHGYVSGDFRGHVYEDVVDQLGTWSDAGIDLFVYSSGSVQAQKLLFGYSEAGDLGPLFSDYFDTRVGHKQEPSSYREIASQIGKPPEDILFLSDVAAELDAASVAGMRTTQLVRDDSVMIGQHPVATDFRSVII